MTQPATLITSIESEWEPGDGFFWKIRQGVFRDSDFERAFEKVKAVPTFSDRPVPARLVSLLWYVPLFMQWQVERVREQGGDEARYATATNKMTAEVEEGIGGVGGGR